jgi:hypothetical protein
MGYFRSFLENQCSQLQGRQKSRGPKMASRGKNVSENPSQSVRQTDGVVPVCGPSYEGGLRWEDLDLNPRLTLDKTRAPI